MPLHTRARGNRGEDIACSFLFSKGFKIVDRNYRKMWGELDIIATKDEIIHFFEVKSVITPFSDTGNGHKPEDNVHALKVKRIRRTIEAYVEEKACLNREFQFHVLSVYMNPSMKKARVRWIKNIIL